MVNPGNLHGKPATPVILMQVVQRPHLEKPRVDAGWQEPVTGWGQHPASGQPARRKRPPASAPSSHTELPTEARRGFEKAGLSCRYNSDKHIYPSFPTHILRLKDPEVVTMDVCLLPGGLLYQGRVTYPSQIRVPEWPVKVFGGMGQGHQENEGFINLRQWLGADSFYAFSSLYRISVYSMFRRPHAISRWLPVSKAWMPFAEAG